MLYTVVSLEQIYSHRTKIHPSQSDEIKKEEEYKNINLEHGILRAKREEDHYVVDSIQSTNMSDYLDDHFSPGSILKLE